MTVLKNLVLKYLYCTKQGCSIGPSLHWDVREETDCGSLN